MSRTNVQHLFRHLCIGQDGAMVKLPQPSSHVRGDAMRGPVSYYDPDEVEPMVTAAVMPSGRTGPRRRSPGTSGVSRAPTVSRLLAQARQLGIVRIEIVPPTADRGWARTSRSGSGSPRHPHRRRAGRPRRPAPVLAGQLNDALAASASHPGDVLVVGWGRAIYSLGRYSSPLPGVVVVPA